MIPNVSKRVYPDRYPQMVDAIARAYRLPMWAIVGRRGTPAKIQRRNR